MPFQPAPRRLLLTVGLCALTMIAFAANSVLCRLALGGGMIDAASFSAIRLLSGATALLVIVRVVSGKSSSVRGRWSAAAALFLYAVPFSFAYNDLSAGTGALILFGAVQLTMLVSAVWSGERPHVVEWLGLLLAMGGLVYLVLPGLAAPSPLGSVLMATAGIAWGVYSLLGRGAKEPVAETAGNFLRTVPLAVVVWLAFIPQNHTTTTGVMLAATSGAVTSGMGYALWYTVLKHLTATRAALLQLSVPILVAVGGVLFLSEDVSLRLVISSLLILGGITAAIIGRATLARKRE